jgi:glutamate-1-semialdehyde 2,1-aminomutase
VVTSEVVQDRASAALVSEYLRLTPRSRQNFERSKHVIPDGNDKTGALAPYPTYVTRADGVYLYDIDGRQLLDFVCANMGGVLGHNHPVVRAAIEDQLARGTNFALVADREVELAELLVERIPSAEKVRFTGTGTEATMLAIRLARAHTGRTRIAKIDGGYHGSHDAVWIGSPRQTSGATTVPRGVPARVADEVLLLPFNDVERTADLLAAHGAELAAVIVEPVLGSGGSIPATVDYLAMLRERTAASGTVLIFDEMISLGLARGGAQELFGVIPDLTTAGKSVSGGLPMAFYAGRADIMDLTGKGPVGEPPAVQHVGTYTSLGVAMAAGVAALGVQGPDHFRRLHESGSRVRAGLESLAARRGYPLQITGVGHMWGWFWSEDPVRDYEDARRSDARMAAAVQLALLNDGYFVGPSRAVVTSVHTPEQIDDLVGAMERAIDRVVELDAG